MPYLSLLEQSTLFGPVAIVLSSIRTVVPGHAIVHSS